MSNKTAELENTEFIISNGTYDIYHIQSSSTIVLIIVIIVMIAYIK